MGTVFSSSEEDDDEELEQEPEMPLFEHSSSPLSPQISMSRSPFFGPSMKNSDPYNAAMTPVSLSPTNTPHLSRFHTVGTTISPGAFLPSWLLASEEFHIEVYLIRHGHSTANLRPEIISGRAPSATLTETGKHEARALGAFLQSTGVVFDAVYCSPLDRAKQTAESVCQCLRIPEEQIEMLEALQELGQGQWEGRLRTEVYSTEILQLMNNTQPDFRAPGGESQRQVEFRMVEFLNNVVLPHAAITLLDEAKLDKGRWNSHPNLGIQGHTLDELEITSASEPKLLETGNVEITSASEPKLLEPGKVEITSASEPEILITVKSTGEDIQLSEHKSENNGVDSQQEDGLRDHISKRDRLPKIITRREPNPPQKRNSYRVAVVSHAMAIKCALRGLLGSDPFRTQKICIDNTSVTVLKHRGSTGWQVQRVNDTAHLRLL